MRVVKSETLIEKIVKRIPLLSKIYYTVLNCLLYRAVAKEGDDESR
jgi:uncharacterized membrane protein